jgi:hypothetical protein
VPKFCDERKVFFKWEEGKKNVCGKFVEEKKRVKIAEG